MTAPSDTFAAFVTMLSAALDDHDATGADLARRMHLSRYHLDRVIAAAAGEPPAALRRRVLLERAAHRLTSTRRTILEIAVEAGYSSHEAFTRAFTRAYGVSPRQWRAAPRAARLPSRNGVHFHPPASLGLPALTKVGPMDLLLKMVEHHVWLVGELLTRAQTLTDEQLDKPIEISVDGIDCDPTLRSLLSRLVGQLDMWNNRMADRDYDWSVESHETVAHMRARHAAVGPAYLASVRELCEESRLAETFVDTQCDPPEVFTYGGMIAHVLTFAAHRRTLALGALHDAGITDLAHGDPAPWMVATA
ncbi:AraC family transcriptional regulator [Luedemannella helvata]|uniref:AraC family transcriptional regulator n=1 Tax=Luedemannella helvata TaxID=349315 RepID=A0ABP4XI81_9ACTN